MKSFFLLSALSLMSAGWMFGQAKRPGNQKTKLENQVKQYWFVLIKDGPNTDADSTSKAILFGKHIANINKLYYDGILKAAGPFGENDNQWRGLFVLDCAKKEDAEKVVQTDPAVAAGLLTVEITPWYTASVGSFKKGKPLKP